jgi:hypothetical protein
LLHLIKKYKKDYIETYIQEYKNSILLNDHSINEEHINAVVQLPDDFKLLSLNYNNNSYKKYINYLKDRGIKTEEEFWYWKFGISENYEGLYDRIIVPSFDNFGKLNYFSARTIKDIKPKYINPTTERENIIFNELNIQWNKELTLVEGVFDLIKCNENATCILGSDLTANYDLFHKIVINQTPIVLGLDPDAKRKTMKIAERLYEFCVPVKIIEYNDSNDIGSKTKNEFNDLLSHAKLYDIEYKLKYKLNSII